MAYGLVARRKNPRTHSTKRDAKVAGADLDGLGQVPRVAFSVVDCVCIRARTGPAKKCPVRSTGLRNAAGSWALLVIAVALQFWLFPWGSYEITFEDKVPITRVAGPIQALASLILAGGLALLSGSVVRTGLVAGGLSP